MRSLSFLLLLALPPACNRQGEDVSGAAASGEAGTTSPAARSASIKFVSLTELEAELARARGHGFLLNFWAIWCAPCVAELPSLVETARAFESRGGGALLVSYDMMVPGARREAVEPAMKAFLEKKKIDLPVLVYEAADYETINTRFGLPGEVPVTLAIDRNGKIVDRQEEAADKRRMAEMMERALAP
jgi:thiol-disulfide isomerase/thioredoxin